MDNRSIVKLHRVTLRQKLKVQFRNETSYTLSFTGVKTPIALSGLYKEAEAWVFLRRGLSFENAYFNNSIIKVKRALILREYTFLKGLCFFIIVHTFYF